LAEDAFLRPQAPSFAHFRDSCVPADVMAID
jgi:hypothetical protein